MGAVGNRFRDSPGAQRPRFFLQDLRAKQSHFFPKEDTETLEFQ
jgi:hypothetical protein